MESKEVRTWRDEEALERYRMILPLLDPEAYVSMNMWGLTPHYVELLEEGFRRFFEDIASGDGDLLTSEYLLPIHIDKLLQEPKSEYDALVR